MPRVTVEVSAATRDLLHANAKKYGMSLSRYTKLVMWHAARELTERAVAAAIDGALGEVARQIGEVQPTLREAVSAGKLAAKPFLPIDVARTNLDAW